MKLPSPRCSKRDVIAAIPRCEQFIGSTGGITAEPTVTQIEPKGPRSGPAGLRSTTATNGGAATPTATQAARGSPRRRAGPAAAELHLLEAGCPAPPATNEGKGHRSAATGAARPSASTDTGDGGREEQREGAGSEGRRRGPAAARAARVTGGRKVGAGSGSKPVFGPPICAL